MAKSKTPRANLTDRLIRAAECGEKEVRLYDAKVPALFVRILPSGIKSWGVVYGRNRVKAIGKWPGVSVDAARVQAIKAVAETNEHGAPVAVAKPKAAVTVGDACAAYVAALKKAGREATAADAGRRFARCIYPDSIGAIKLADLHQDHVEAWRDRIEAGDLPELPRMKGRPPCPKPLSKATANRIRTQLVAALNHAVARRQVAPERAIEWTSVKPHEGATRRRELYLDITQRRALLAAADGGLHDLIECVALTGCRPGDPAACLREDYDARSGTVRFHTKGHDRKVPLASAAKALFDRLARGRLPKAHLFVQDDGRPWTASAWSAPVRAAAVAADLPGGVTLYTLRHCWITDAIVGGMDLLSVAKLAGTSLAMIEKHYGHLVHGAARDKLQGIAFL